MGRFLKPERTSFRIVWPQNNNELVFITLRFWMDLFHVLITSELLVFLFCESIYRTIFGHKQRRFTQVCGFFKWAIQISQCITRIEIIQLLLLYLALTFQTEEFTLRPPFHVIKFVAFKRFFNMWPQIYFYYVTIINVALRALEFLDYNEEVIFETPLDRMEQLLSLSMLVQPKVKEIFTNQLDSRKKVT